VPKHALKTVWDRNIAAGIVLEGRSSGGNVPVYSHSVSGRTTLYGYPVGFDALITAAKTGVVLDVVFDPQKTQGGPVPQDARVEVDSAGHITTGPIPPEAYRAVTSASAILRMPCSLVVILARFGAPL
jgi:hypothetical protein